MFLDIPLLLITSFLLSTAVIVFYSIKKFTSFRVYAIGNRQFSTGSLLATALATFYGGATLITNITSFSFQPFWIISRLINICIPFLILSFLSIKMSKFIYHISMPETIGRVYGKYPRVIIALLSVCLSIILFATQVHILSQVITGCISSVNPLFITILTALLLVAYTIFGGSRAVVLTDVWQFITFVSLICLLGWFMFTKTGHSLKETVAFITSQKELTSTQRLVGREGLVSTLRCLSFVFAFIEPGFIHYMYMAAQAAQAKKVCLYGAIIGSLIMLCCIVTGAFASVWLPSDLPRDKVLHYILTHISPLFKGIFCICLLALTMSTADSRLHICAVMISYDIVPLLLPLRLRKKLSCRHYYIIAYISMLIVAMLSIALCLHNASFFTFRIITQWIGRFYAPMVTAPFILAVLGFNSNSRIAFSGMAAGALAVLAWRKWVYPILLTDSSTFPCVLVNGLTMLGLHYLWRWLKRRKKVNKVTCALPDERFGKKKL